jgi:hypothetical protein
MKNVKLTSMIASPGASWNLYIYEALTLVRELEFMKGLEINYK